MKKLTALAAGVLLLSSSLLVGCNAANNAADDRGTTYDANRGGRVMVRDTDRLGVDVNPTRDEDRLGVIDDIGPDNNFRGNVNAVDRRNTFIDRDPNLRDRNMRGLNNFGVAGTGYDQDRLGVRDNWGPDWGRNLRNDKALEARVEDIPGVRNATVLVGGNTAYVALNTGNRTLGTNNNGTVLNRGTDRTRTYGGNRVVRDYGVTPYGGTMGDRDYNARQGIMGTGIGNVTDNNDGLYADDMVSSDMKARVAAAVRGGNKNIRNVYVSANPALLDRMDAFARDAGAGRPARGANDLGDMFRRMFPAAR